MTVILPCWIISEELEQLTKNAVSSLGNVELIVIDNASTQGGGYLRSVADVYIRNKENLGYAKAVNQGLKLTKTDLVAIANNDIVVSPNWIETVEEIAKGNAGSIHPRMINYDQPFEYGNKVVKTGKERWCQGSFFVLKKNEGYQLYDEGFLNSYDDWDYFYRLRKQYPTVYTDKACFKHLHSSSQKYNPQREEINKKNAEYFKTLHGQYAERLFEETYPEQMQLDYWRGFEL